MANLGNTIINGILRVNGDINAGGSIKAPTLIGNLTGNASSATKLQTARKINGIAFDGTKDIIIEAGSSGHTILNSSGTTMAQRSKLKFMNSTVTDDSANDTTIITPSGITGNYLPLSGGTMTGTIISNMITESHLNGNKGKAVIDIINSNAHYVTVLRTNATDGKFTLSSDHNYIVLGYTSNNSINTGTNAIDRGIHFESDGSLYPRHNNVQNLGSSERKWNSIYATGFIGNATTANTLQTARAINGTSFNGSANITTANWGTARNIGIVNSDGTGTAVVTSVNGSANINLKLPSTIKATITGNASTASTLANARTINGTSFNGSANITTANWGTARNLTIGNTSKSVNGSANVTWSLSEIGAAPTSHNHSYLPLSGGTLTTNSYNGLTIKRSDANGSSILYSNSAGALGRIGFNSGGDLIITNGTGTDGTANMLNIKKDGNIIIYNSLSPSSNNSRTLGTSALKWNNVYATTFTGNLSGNASTATKLQTARTISHEGDLTGSYTFDGSANITDTAYINYCKAIKSNTNNYPYCRIATSGVVTGSYQDKTALFYITQDYNNGKFGLVRVSLRTNSSSTASNAEVKWLVRSGFNTDDVQAAIYDKFGATYVDVFYKCNGNYCNITARALQGNRGSVGNSWTLINSSESDNAVKHTECFTAIQGTTAGQAAQDLHNGQQYNYVVSGIDDGIVKTANQLTTARTINGTSFNGSANITTANWGTARNIGIVNSDGTGTAVPVSVNGSGNVNLKLPATIKASLSGNASTATTATKANQLTTARTIGVSGVTGTAQSFNGTANITIPITAVPASLLTGKNAIKASEINNDKHFIPSSTNTVANIVAMTQSSFNSSGSSLPNNTLVAITDGNDSYVSTQATSITCDLPLDL